MPAPLNRHSRRITQTLSQPASQAQLYATGFTEEDFDKAQVGIGSVWFEGNCCNMHLLDLAGWVKEGVEEAGLKGMEVYYGTYSPEDERRFKNLAEHHGLIPCGGSDYHGNSEGQRLPGAIGPPASSVDALRAQSRNAGS